MIVNPVVTTQLVLRQLLMIVAVIMVKMQASARSGKIRLWQRRMTHLETDNACTPVLQ